MPIEKVIGYRILCDQKRVESNNKTGLSVRPCKSAFVIVCDDPKSFGVLSEESVIDRSIQSGFRYDPKNKTFICAYCIKEEKKIKPQLPKNYN